MDKKCSQALQGLYLDLKRLAADNRSKYAETKHEKWRGMEYAYEAAAQKVKRIKGVLK